MTFCRSVVAKLTLELVGVPIPSEGQFPWCSPNFEETDANIFFDVSQFGHRH